MLRNVGQAMAKRFGQLRAIWVSFGTKMMEMKGVRIIYRKWGLTYVNLKLMYVRGPSRTLPNISRTLSGSKIASGRFRHDLTYVTVKLTYVNHPRNPAHVRESSKTRRLRKQHLKYVSSMLTYIRHCFRGIRVFDDWRTCARFPWWFTYVRWTVTYVRLGFSVPE